LPLISKITTQKRKADRYNIYLDNGHGEEYAFSVSEDVLIKHQLMKGKEISEDDIQNIFYQEEIEKAYIQAINFLSYRMRSTLEVRQHIEEKGFEQTLCDTVIQRLKEQNYLNDEEFALSYLRTQIQTTDKGPVVIANSLKEKGITQKLIDEVLLEFPKELELEKAITLCEKWIQKKNTKSEKQVRVDLKAMLHRKGYTLDIIQQAIHTSVQEVFDENQEKKAIKLQIQKAYSKYRMLSEFERNMKIKQFLFRKGFPYDLIEEAIHSIDHFISD